MGAVINVRNCYKLNHSYPGINLQYLQATLKTVSNSTLVLGDQNLNKSEV